MRVRVQRKCIHVAAGVLAIAAAGAQPLVAQGGEKLLRPAAAPATSLESSHVEPARGILRNLVGTWHFDIWFAGNFDGPPDASGTRVVRTLFDDMRLEWTEELDHSSIKGQGILGFDSRTESFFSASVYSVGSAPEFLAGTLDSAEPLIRFSPLTASPEASAGQKLTGSAALSMVDQNHFTWAPRDRAWRAVFTRQQ